MIVRSNVNALTSKLIEDAMKRLIGVFLLTSLAVASPAEALGERGACQARAKGDVRQFSDNMLVAEFRVDDVRGCLDSASSTGRIFFGVRVADENGRVTTLRNLDASWVNERGRRFSFLSSRERLDPTHAHEVLEVVDVRVIQCQCVD